MLISKGFACSDQNEFGSTLSDNSTQITRIKK
jgi:hypothetical protein